MMASSSECQPNRGSIGARINIYYILLYLARKIIYIEFIRIYLRAQRCQNVCTFPGGPAVPKASPIGPEQRTKKEIFVRSRAALAMRHYSEADRSYLFRQDAELSSRLENHQKTKQFLNRKFLATVLSQCPAPVNHQSVLANSLPFSTIEQAIER